MPISINTWCLVLLSAFSGIAVLYFGQDVLVPIVSAFLLGIVMTPLSDFWDRLRVPTALASLLSVALALAILFVLILLIEPYVTHVINQAPLIRDEVRETVDEARRLLRGLEEISADVAAAIDADPAATAEDAAMAVPSITDALFYAPQVLAQLLIFAGTLYFFLLTRSSVYGWLNRTFTWLQEADLRRAAGQVSRYVLTISAINFTFGVLVSIVMQIIGMPSPVIWGLLAFVLNFILYLGPVFLFVTLLITGIVVFEGAASFLPAAIYIAMNATEAQFVTPTLVGRSLSVNPLLVFLSLVFWLWLWGPVGGIIAIPMLIWTLTVAQGLPAQAISAGTPGRA
ncbi:AI-2E family transporter [Loktanella sp. D2R18]|uniref:AI-2E family transporter n=1 Tax=Rhodobacterales TaxID=204455 RepID=UPI000DEA9805|nr:MULTISPECIES: AI-2E family transporter [Rhodobacterales]MDO6590338.1 AI-2E family transporter [Yoonia sp. 1_MG-2023]RBW42859.1 AI-2E family transporter [Loktanella sp. D2R18]